MLKTILSLTLVLTLSFGCATSSNMPTEADINAEAAKAYNDVKAKSKISRNMEWTQMVERVSQRIAASTNEKFEWEAILIDDPQPNAWCMPGGKIAVYTGIMPVLKTEGALAAVLGHEVAHATQRHGQKAYARAIKDNQKGLIIGVASIVGGELLCKTQDCKRWTALGGAAAGLAITFFSRKFSRADETEADSVGQVLMAKAGYDPAESINLWERMGAASGGKAPPEWMSTHPSDKTRRARLSQSLPQAMTVYRQAPQKYGTGTMIR